MPNWYLFSDLIENKPYFYSKHSYVEQNAKFALVFEINRTPQKQFIVVVAAADYNQEPKQEELGVVLELECWN